jgi:hypothetical protein
MVAASIPQVISFFGVSYGSIKVSPLVSLSSFGRLCFATPNHGARRSGPLKPRLEWQDARRSLCFPPPVGADIRSRGFKGARLGHINEHSH